MVRAEDVASYILRKKGSMSAMKLQKLVYYTQAWSLVWDDRPLFEEEIQAWMSGPVIRALYDKHKGLFTVVPEVFHGDPSKLDKDQQETVDAVLDFYGDRPAQWLSDLTHKERPWKLARTGVPDMENSENEITKNSMGEYYTRVSEVAAQKPAKTA